MLRHIRCVVAALQELTLELNVEALGTEFGAFSYRNLPHFGWFFGFGRVLATHS